MTTTSIDQPVAVVTGAARGIGYAIAEWFLARDYRVALMDYEAETLKQAAEKLSSLGAVMPLHCDVSDADSVTIAIDQIDAEWGRVDALVNNAGIAIFKPLLETSFDEWRGVLATNLDGVFLCSQACGAIMKRQGSGSIVNIASISGLRASTLRVAYGTSKAAVIHLTKQYAVELGTLGIRVNAVAPGPVDTEMAKLVHSPEIRRDYHDTIPLERYGSCEEIANAVGFLCLPEAGYINGQVLAVDGGFDAAGVGLPTLREAQQGR
jgi:meso-butanediol dehydrogenase/(S,S)-butanediol dehydrogenase/diacetyl reductase